MTKARTKSLDEMQGKDEAAIAAYIGRMQSYFERSNMGGITNHLMMRSEVLAEEYAQEHGYSIYPDGAITAQPGPEDHSSTAADDEESLRAKLEEYARPSRLLLLVGRRSRVLQDALMAHNGPFGDKWALHPLQRIAALFHLVPAGKQMLEEHAPKPAAAPVAIPVAEGMNREQRRAAARATAEQIGGATGALTDDDGAARMVGLLAGTLSDDLAVGCARAETQARALYRRAARAWNEIDAEIELGRVPKLRKAGAR